MNSFQVFKIKHPTQNLYSTGGLMFRWSKIGKVWHSKQHLQSHLNMVFRRYGNSRNPYEGASIIVYNADLAYSQEIYNS